MSKPVAIITGASSGIGQAVAAALADKGYRLALTARRRERLEVLRDKLEEDGGTARIFAADLSSASDVDELVPRILEDMGQVDVLVNNAGYGLQRRFETMEPGGDQRMFAVNVLAPMALARAVIPPMLAQGKGSIINIASVGGVVAHPLNVTYCASKHALVGFSKSLRLELWGTGVGVTAVCPGATRTEFFDVARSDIPFNDMIDRFAAPPETVAQTVLQAIRNNRAVLFPTWSAWFLHFADRWLPPLSALGNVRYRDQVLELAERESAEGRPVS